MLIRLLGLMALAVAAAHPVSAAEIPSKLNPAAIASIKSIGVISAVGDILTFTTNGVTRFDLSSNSHPIADMGIDDALEARVGQIVGPQIKVEKVEYDRAKFSAVTVPNFFWPDINPVPLQDLVNGLSAPVDGYLIISKSPIPFGLSKEILRPGLNISRGGFHQNHFSVFPLIFVSFFDARTHVLLAQAVFPPPISQFWGGTIERLPLDGALWPDDTGTFTQPQYDALKKVLTDDLDTIVSKSVGQFGLAPPPQQ